MFLCTVAGAQKKFIQGKIIDQVTREAVPYVHVFPMGNSFGTISDLKGEFTLHVDGAKSDSIRISCIGYKTQKLSLKKITGKLTLELEEDRVLLPGLTVYDLTAKEFVRKCVNKIPVNYRFSKNSKDAFYWKSVKLRDEYKNFYETYLTLTSKSRLLSYDSLIIHINGKSTRINVYDSLIDILKFDVVNQGSMFVNMENINDWKFEYLYSSEYPDDKFVVIGAEMIQSAFNSDKKRDSNRLKIFIQSETHAIVRVDFSYSWEAGKRHHLQEDIYYFLDKLNGTVEYKRNVNSKYDLSYLFIDTEFSFVKRYNPLVLYQALINHELVVLPDQKSREKPVVRWGDYLEASDKVKTTN